MSQAGNAPAVKYSITKRIRLRPRPAQKTRVEVADHLRSLASFLDFAGAFTSSWFFAVGDLAATGLRAQEVGRGGGKPM